MQSFFYMMHDVIQNSTNIVIVSHKNPDGDAVGSSLALYHYLKKIKKQVTVVLPDSFPDYFQWLNGTEHIIIAENHLLKAKEKLDEADLIFCLDFNDLSRIGSLEDSLKNSNAFKIMIDHHQNPKDFADCDFHNPKACSTAQLIYEFIESYGDLNLIDATIGECIYTGIITDTGSFKYSNVDSKTHTIAADLIHRGLDHNKVHESIFDQNSISRLHLLGYALGKIEVMEDLPVAFIALSKKDLKRFNFSKGDTEGLVNYCLSINGIDVAAFIKEDVHIIKMSFRSKGIIKVNEFASKYFNGGGHLNAAGGRSDLTFIETVEKFKVSIKLFLND